MTTKVERQEPRNKRIIRAVRPAAIAPSRNTESTEALTNTDWSNSSLISMPGGAEARATFRRFGAKPDKKICRRSGGEPEFMEDATHGRLDGIVVEIDRIWDLCAARGAEWLSGSEQGFDPKSGG